MKIKDNECAVYIVEYGTVKLEVENKKFFQHDIDLVISYINSMWVLLKELINKEIDNIVINFKEGSLIISFLDFESDGSGITWIMISDKYKFKNNYSNEIKEINSKISKESNITKLEDIKERVVELDTIELFENKKEEFIKIDEKYMPEIRDIFKIIIESFNIKNIDLESITIDTKDKRLKIINIVPIELTIKTKKDEFKTYIQRLIEASNSFPSLKDLALFERVVYEGKIESSGEAAVLPIRTITTTLDRLGIKKSRIEVLKQRLNQLYNHGIINDFSDYISIIETLDIIYSIDPQTKLLQFFEESLVHSLYSSRDILKIVREGKSYKQYENLLKKRLNLIITLNKIKELEMRKREIIWIRSLIGIKIDPRFMNYNPESIATLFLQRQDANLIFYTAIKHPDETKKAIEHFLKERFLEAILVSIADVMNKPLFVSESRKMLKEYERSTVILKDRYGNEIAKFWLVVGLLKEILYGKHKYLIEWISFPIYLDPNKTGILVTYKDGYWTYKTIRPRKYEFYIVGNLSKLILSNEKKKINKIKETIKKLIKR